MSTLDHFTRYAPEHIEYGINRYQNETRRLYGVLDKHLASDNRPYIVGEKCTIAGKHTCFNNESKSSACNDERVWFQDAFLAVHRKSKKPRQTFACPKQAVRSDDSLH